MVIDLAVIAPWMLSVFGAVIGFFMIRTLLKIDKNLERHDKQISNITMIQIKMLTKMGVDDDYYEKLAQDIKQPE